MDYLDKVLPQFEQAVIYGVDVRTLEKPMLLRVIQLLGNDNQTIRKELYELSDLKNERLLRELKG